jgi:NTE family protein
MNPPASDTDRTDANGATAATPASTPIAEASAPRGAGEIGLVLPGGGARAAYQVGVLRGIAELSPAGMPTPFRVIAGTSAGAINAAMIASHAHDFATGVRELERLWSEIRSEQVFRTGPLVALRTSMRWMMAIVSGKLKGNKPMTLLDNAPLRELLDNNIDFLRLRRAISSGNLRALSITASGYTSARSISFFDGADDLVAWHRMRRLGEAVAMNVDHIMASVALPVIFPAVRIGREFFGDGSLRQMAPLSPVLHLGADKILVIASRNEDPNRLPETGTSVPYPSLGQIAGYLLDTLFMDSIYADHERLERINHTIRRLHEPPSSEQPLHHVESLIITPSADIREIAQRHKDEFPASVRMLLNRVGGMNRSSSQLLSYLLFESGYCSELIELGLRDARAQSDALRAFLQAPTPATRAQ